ncbi:MFS transporter [Sciscionella sediminilitoris]|uniref:MFS transporter n=1 Tax=Sciscionella sediminilitoris TaxID=1445613 RepID=UPI000689B156|nr:MFS transporter [Sciscionella sp. SE31]
MAATMLGVFARREFRGLWTAELLSTFGDQMARVALSVLVYGRTGSALLTGVAYAATFVPTLISGMFLGRIADRWPRRRVLIVADLVRAVLASVMAIPGMAWAWLIGLIAVITAIGPVFKAAQTAITAEVLPDESEFKLAQGLRFGTVQLGQLGGFAVGGVIALSDPALGLLINAATFLASAACLTLLRARPTPDTGQGKAPSVRALVASSPVVRALLGVSLILVPLIVPEAVAVPLAYELGEPSASGWILAAAPLGSVVGVLPLRWPVLAERDRQVMVPAAAAGGVPLLLCGLPLPLPLVVALLALSGGALMVAMTVTTNLVTLAVPDRVRGAIGGLWNAVISITQGVGAALGGAIAGASTAAIWTGRAPS